MVREIIRCKVEIIALQETKQMGSDVVDVEHMTIFKSDRKDRVLGTGWCKKNFKEKIVSFKPISE